MAEDVVKSSAGNRPHPQGLRVAKFPGHAQSRLNAGNVKQKRRLLSFATGINEIEGRDV